MLPRFIPTDPARLLALWLFGRLICATFVVGLPFIPSLGAYNDDVELYLLWAQDIASGRFPFDDAMWQYPPLAGVVFLAAALISPHSITGFVMLALAADAAIAFLLLQRPKIDGLRLWVLAPALIGPVMLGRFDVFPAAFAVAALLLLSTHPKISSFMISAGALLKIWPALILVAIRKPARHLVLVGLTVIAFMAFVLPLSGGALAFLKNQEQRGIQIESIWALPYLIAKSFGAEIPIPYQFGAREVSAFGIGTLASLSTAITALAILTIAFLRWSGRLDHFHTSEVAFTSVLASVAFSKVISPQYAVWILALAAVCVAHDSCVIRKVLPLLMWWSLLGFALYPFLYDGLRDGFILSVLVQTARTGLLLTAFAALVHDMLSGSTPASIDLRRPAGVSQVQLSSTHERPA